MGKTYGRNNNAGRRSKRFGREHFSKSDIRSRNKGKDYSGSFSVTFDCKKELHVPHASSKNVRKVAKGLHYSGNDNCRINMCQPKRVRRLVKKK